LPIRRTAFAGAELGRLSGASIGRYATVIRRAPSAQNSSRLRRKWDRADVSAVFGVVKFTRDAHLWSRSLANLVVAGCGGRLRRCPAIRCGSSTPLSIN
jgi:hypothetical protein